MAFKVNYKRECGKYTQMNFTSSELGLLSVLFREYIGERSTQKITPLYVQIVIKEIIQETYNEDPENFDKFSFLLTVARYAKWDLCTQHFDSILQSVLNKK